MALFGIEINGLIDQNETQSPLTVTFFLFFLTMTFYRCPFRLLQNAMWKVISYIFSPCLLAISHITSKKSTCCCYCDQNTFFLLIYPAAQWIFRAQPSNSWHYECEVMSRSTDSGILYECSGLCTSKLDHRLFGASTLSVLLYALLNSIHTYHTQ